jgi:formylglycine-generating enzyme required for sulfatase activity
MNVALIVKKIRNVRHPAGRLGMGLAVACIIGLLGNAARVQGQTAPTVQIQLDRSAGKTAKVTVNTPGASGNCEVQYAPSLATPIQWLTLTNLLISGNSQVVSDPVPASGNRVYRALVKPSSGTAPAITVQPADVGINAGEAATFAVTASGTSPMTYNWRFAGRNLADDSRITGSGTSSLTISGVQLFDAGGYQAVVSNAFGYITSRVAVLSVTLVTNNPGAPIDLDANKWIWIPAGSFAMGSPNSEADRYDDENPITQVSITNGFWIAKKEVTQAEYQAAMGNNPSWYKSNVNNPVEQVSWHDATNYCAKLNELGRADRSLPRGFAYRLPTEAEWEYAARAGTTTRFSFGDDASYSLLAGYGWFSVNGADTTHPVASKQPNPWNINDMYGNVWEWCMDWYGAYPGGAMNNPRGPQTGTLRVFRGGSYNSPGGDCRSAVRNFVSPDEAYADIGIRIVLAPEPPPPPGGGG